MNRHIAFRAWDTDATFGAGILQGALVSEGALRYDAAAGVRRYADPYAADPAPAGFEWAAWVSPPVEPGFAFTSLIPSWNAATPDGSWLEVEMRVSRDGIAMSPWYTLARWAETDRDIHATSVTGQDDDAAQVLTDVLMARDGVTWTSYQLRVVLLRRPGSDATPTVRLVSAVASDVRHEPPATTSAAGPVRGRELAVPAYSQRVHRGEYPDWDSGGESWCSPTSVSMVLGSWGRGPDPAEYAWVDPAVQDRFVDHAARRVFDHAYGGAGNWSFNTAYAARYGTTAFVTRLRDLTEAERFVGAGIPLVATVAFRREEMDGAGYDTDGHLLTIVGFDAHGDVISNDPASHGKPSNDEVRSVYDRAQFERAWLGSGGVVYVIYPPSVALPPAPVPTEPNW
ncbi:MAG: C39 family peptidase [Nocardioidaceae bacterium]